MRIDILSIRPIREELDVLDHRRARLYEILELRLVSPEMQAQLQLSLADVERRIEQLTAEADPVAVRRAA
jgi:hypothetical protein